jgi:ATP-dependent Lhr-like helicase
VLEPEETFIGTLNEDFAIESNVGDIFQLGNTSWQVLKVGAGEVRVADAKGAPPNLPFWLGEAPARSDELSRAVSDLRVRIESSFGMPHQADVPSRDDHAGGDEATHAACPLPHAAVAEECGIPEDAARDITDYLAESHRILGALPTQDTLVLERFFDESGGMQLVLHSPFGSRINRAWGLALRKRFCRQFNFELQAAATEEALLLSLGPQHSFPLADVFRYLHPATAKDVLVQAFLDAPVWQTRWRWNTTISLAIPRNRNGRKVPPQLQRAMADDLMAAVFPDAAACFENIAGDRELPDHPLVNQAVRDCLYEAMDFDGLARVLTRIHAGEINLVARDTPEPSPLSHEIINAKPYAFLDDAPLEERRTQAVYARRTGDENGILDPAAIARVRDEARPDPRDADELHDALLTAGFLLDGEFEAEMMAGLVRGRRAGHISGVWIAAERLPEILAIHPQRTSFTAPASRAKTWTRDEALVELLRGRMTVVGPITTAAVAASVGIEAGEVESAMLSLEAEGLVLRGGFTSPAAAEWCDRTLLARIHRYTLNRLRAEIEPVSIAEFTRFLFAWQHISGKLTGIDGLRALLDQLAGYEAPATAWERSIFAARMDRYDASMLDALCLSGEFGWAKGVAIDRRTNLFAPATLPALSEGADALLEHLKTNGASFLKDDDALRELVSSGLVTSDGFAGARGSGSPGRWSVLPTGGPNVEALAMTLLQRYGVIFRRLLTREPNAPPWRDLVRIYRRLEARGEIRGGRFVNGVSGEQFALPRAVERLRETRRTAHDGHIIVISACDPLNLTGILTAGERVRAIAATRIAFRDGVPICAMEGDYLRPLLPVEDAVAFEAASMLAGRRVPVSSGFVGRAN